MIRGPDGIRIPLWFFIGIVLIAILTTGLISKWIFASSNPPMVVAPPIQTPVAQSPMPSPALPPTPQRAPSAQNLADAFAPNSYPKGVVIVGARSKVADRVSTEASKHFVDLLSLRLKAKDRDKVVDEFRPAVFTAGYFDQVLDGNVTLLAPSGLTAIMHAAILAYIEAECSDPTTQPGVVSCTVSVRMRVVGEEGNSSFLRFSNFLRFTETGDGRETAQALQRASEILLDHHPEIFDGT